MLHTYLLTIYLLENYKNLRPLVFTSIAVGADLQRFFLGAKWLIGKAIATREKSRKTQHACLQET